MYRTGILYFYNNTVISTRNNNTTLLRLSLNEVSADVRNNVIYATAGGSYLAITSGSGQSFLKNNWLNTNWKKTHESSLDPGASVNDLGNITGNDPGFKNFDNQNFIPATGSPLLENSKELADAALPVTCSLKVHQDAQGRIIPLNIGAF
jgi:hypothetical protein